MNVRGCGVMAALAIGAVAVPLYGQGFGMAKAKVTLERKLPALIQLPGDTIRVKVVGHQDQADLARDLQALMETELLKDKPELRDDEDHAAVTVYCQIISYERPSRTVTRVAGYGSSPPQDYTRIAAAISVAFQARTTGGRSLESDNIEARYDEQFDSAGNNTSHGLMGGLTSGWHKLKGNNNSAQEEGPPTDDQARSIVMMMAVRRVAEHIVNTDESVDVFLARNKGALDEGDKAAEAGLWERALETFETAPPLTKKDDDAYRLYNIGVANEALGYQARDTKTAMKFLDQAAIEYGKAIDEKPGEKYFLVPQKRIETALAHYHRLEALKNAPVVAENEPPPPPKPAADPAPDPAPHTMAAAEVRGHSAAAAPHSGTIHSRSLTQKALTNTQIIAMVKAGVADDIVAQSVRNAKSVDFDLSLAARRHLTESGVSPDVLQAMKLRWAQELTSGK